MSQEPSKGGIERIGRLGQQSNSRQTLIKTGIRTLDQKLGMELSLKKGIPQGSLVLVFYPSETVIPLLFVQRILLNWAKDKVNNAVFYVHSSKPIDLVLRAYEAYGWDARKYMDESMFFENMYDLSSPSIASSSKLGRIEVKRKTFAKRILKKMEHFHENQNKICFSVFDDLLWMKEDQLDENPNALIIFLKDTVRLLTKIGGVHFFLLPKQVLEPIAERIIMNSVQVIFDFSRSITGSRIQDNFAITKLMGVAFKAELLELTPSEEEGFKIESTSKI